MNKPIKILVHGLFGIGGTESFFMNYYRNINPDKVQFDFLFVKMKPPCSQEIEKSGSKVYLIPGRKRYIAHRRALFSIFSENKYDGLWSNRCILPGTRLLFKIACKFDVPLRILHAHNSDNMGHWLNGLFHEIEKYHIEKYVTDFWACSEKAGKFFYRNRIRHSSKYKVINNAINLDDFKFDGVTRDSVRKTLKLENKLIIGHIGRFHFQKNHIFLIRVFHEIYKKEPNAILLLVGRGKLRSKIESMAKSLNIIDAVHFLGVRYDIPVLLSAMDIFVLPSKFEGLGIVLIEAQAASLCSFASTNVPTCAKVTELLTFIDLKKTPKEWAELILKKRDYDRKDRTEEIRNAGYDIKTEAAKLEQYLLNRFENRRTDHKGAVK